MNYNPYAYYMPLANTPTKAGLFRSLFRGINLGKILTNTGKTLNVINQAIPLVKQVSPIVKNAKTMFKVMNEKDLSIVTKGLSDIVPAVKDAEEYMSYSNYEHSLVQKMHQAYYEGKLDEFKKTEEYTELVNVRRDLTGRIKIYVKNYYMNL